MIAHAEHFKEPPLNSELHETTARQIKLFFRQIWKCNMLSSPDFGKIWSLYIRIGEEFELSRFPEDALENYHAAIKMCGNLTGQHALRKKSVALFRIIQALSRYPMNSRSLIHFKHGRSSRGIENRN